MYLIASFGVLMVIICSLMAVNPKQYSEGIFLFSEKIWFHLFEILSRAVMGVIFITYSSATLYPLVFSVLGYGLIVVAIGLVMLAPLRHKSFAVWAAQNFENKIQAIGIISIPLGVLIIYMALGGIYAYKFKNCRTLRVLGRACFKAL